LEVPFKTYGIPPFAVTAPECPECIRENEERLGRAHLQRREEQRLERLYRNIPARFREAKMSDFQKIETVVDWIRNPREFFMIIGACGTGKSRLACAMTMALRESGVDTRLVFSSDLFLTLRKSFNHDKNENITEFRIIDALANENVVVFDDIGVQKQSEYVIEAWYNIIDSRYRECKPTAFTSNLTLKEISACMSDRIASRLLSGTIVTLIGRDRRAGS